MKWLRKPLDLIGYAALGLFTAFLFVVMPFFMAGQFFAGFRIYLTGTPVQSHIESCQPIPHPGRNGISGFSYRVKTAAWGDPLSIDYCHRVRSVGQPVTVLHSRAADQALAVAGAATLWNVIRSQNSGTGLIAFLYMAAGVSYLAVWRATSIVTFVRGCIREAWKHVRDSAPGSVARAVRLAAFATDLAFLALLVCALAILIFALCKGLLYLESASFVWFSVLSLALLALIWSPAPVKLTHWIWGSYRNGGLALLRNLVAGYFMVRACHNILGFMRSLDVGSDASLLEFVKALLKAAIGYDGS